MTDTIICAPLRVEARAIRRGLRTPGRLGGAALPGRALAGGSGGGVPPGRALAGGSGGASPLADTA